MSEAQPPPFRHGAGLGPCWGDLGPTSWLPGSPGILVGLSSYSLGLIWGHHAAVTTRGRGRVIPRSSWGHLRIVLRPRGPRWSHFGVFLGLCRARPPPLRQGVVFGHSGVLPGLQFEARLAAAGSSRGHLRSGSRAPPRDPGALFQRLHVDSLWHSGDVPISTEILPGALPPQAQRIGSQTHWRRQERGRPKSAPISAPISAPKSQTPDTF